VLLVIIAVAWVETETWTRKCKWNNGVAKRTVTAGAPLICFTSFVTMYHWYRNRTVSYTL